MLYSNPDPSTGALTTIVPVFTAQVGCNVALAVGADGAPAAALIVTLVPAEIQVLSDVLLTVTLLAPAVTPVKVTLAW